MEIDPLELRAAQDFFGFLRTEPIEKDWHVIRAIQAISQVDSGIFRLVFAGGTCLARAHKLVQRMSEDVDFNLVLRGAAPNSANQLRKALAFLNDDPAVAARYNSFVAAMVYGHQSLFRDAIATVSEIAEQVWP